MLVCDGHLLPNFLQLRFVLYVSLYIARTIVFSLSVCFSSMLPYSRLYHKLGDATRDGNQLIWQSARSQVLHA